MALYNPQELICRYAFKINSLPFSHPPSRIHARTHTFICIHPHIRIHIHVYTFTSTYTEADDRSKWVPFLSKIYEHFDKNCLWNDCINLQITKMKIIHILRDNPMVWDEHVLFFIHIFLFSPIAPNLFSFVRMRSASPIFVTRDIFILTTNVTRNIQIPSIMKRKLGTGALFMFSRLNPAIHWHEKEGKEKNYQCYEKENINKHVNLFFYRRKRKKSYISIWRHFLLFLFFFFLFLFYF